MRVCCKEDSFLSARLRLLLPPMKGIVGQMSTRSLLYTGSATKIVLLLVLGLVSEYGLHRSTLDANWVSHTHEVLTELEGLSRAQYVTENIALRHSIVRDNEGPRDFERARSSVMARLSRLRVLVSDNPLEQRRIDDIRALLERVLTREEDAIDTVLEKGRVHPLFLVIDHQVKEEIWRRIEQMSTQENSLLAQRARASRGSSRLAATLVAVGIVLAVIFVALSTSIVSQDLRCREEAQAELIRAQEKLEERVNERTLDLSNLAARYQTLFDSSPLPMVVFDAETLAFLAVNSAAEELFGYTREEFLRMTLGDTHTPDQVMALREAVRNTEPMASSRTTVTSQDKTGHSLVIELRATMTDFAGQRAWLALMRDITEQRRLEEHLRQSQKMEGIGRLAGGIAHDFNNLLTIILGYCDSLLPKLEQRSPFRPKVLEIQRAGQRAADLTRQLLAFSRKQILQPQILDLNSVVSNTSEMLRRLLGDDIQLSLYLDSNLGQVRADRTQMEQVLVNLAVNSRDAMPGGGRLLIQTQNDELDQHSAGLAGLPPGPYVVLTVSDTGAGMDEQTRARIFEPFFTTKDVGKGTGLGLSTVLGVVQQSGGAVTVYSEVTVGTTFEIYLPRVDTPAGAKQAMDLDPRSPGRNPAVLLVEDEDQVRTWASEILREAGCAVFEATNGLEALEVAEHCSEAPALLLTDVVMPEMSGPELAQRLRRKWPDLVIVYASGYAEHMLIDRSGFQENAPFLQKPYSAACLLEYVNRVGLVGA